MQTLFYQTVDWVWDVTHSCLTVRPGKTVPVWKLSELPYDECSPLVWKLKGEQRRANCPVVGCIGFPWAVSSLHDSQQVYFLCLVY